MYLKQKPPFHILSPILKENKRYVYQIHLPANLRLSTLFGLFVTTNNTTLTSSTTLTYYANPPVNKLFLVYLQ
jgi:hypothetical protein